MIILKLIGGYIVIFIGMTVCICIAGCFSFRVCEIVIEHIGIAIAIIIGVKPKVMCYTFLFIIIGKREGIIEKIRTGYIRY